LINQWIWCMIKTLIEVIREIVTRGVKKCRVLLIWIWSLFSKYIGTFLILTTSWCPARLPPLKVLYISSLFFSRWCGRGIVVVVLSFLFFSYSIVATEPKMNDRLLFTFLFVFVSLAEHCNLENFSDPWHVDSVLFSKYRYILYLREFICWFQFKQKIIKL
jgi:hypothetical protein